MARVYIYCFGMSRGKMSVGQKGESSGAACHGLGKSGQREIGSSGQWRNQSIAQSLNRGIAQEREVVALPTDWPVGRQFISRPFSER